MKTKFLIIMVISIVLIVPSFSYGMWLPQSTEKLLEQSETVFVGTVSSVNILEFERSNTFHFEENGVPRIEIENYTQTLDEYTVDIQEFLKNPQTSNTITMLEATVGGVPGRNVSIGGFELGDRVLFYVPIIDGTNQYSPESFKIPKQCDAKSVLKQPRIQLSSGFKMTQNGVELSDNFTANIPIKSVYEKDTRTLEGASFDVIIQISKVVDGKREMLLDENIHTESKPCEWMTSASWEFTPTAGRYFKYMQTTQGDQGSSTSSGHFTVIEDKFQTKCAPGTVLENGTCGACERGFILFEGECRKITHGESPPISFDEPYHPIPYIQNTSLNQMSIIMLIVIAAIGGCLISLFYFWRKIK